MGISLGISGLEDAWGVAPAGSAGVAARGEGAAKGAAGTAAAAGDAMEDGEGRETDEGEGPDMNSVLAKAGFAGDGLGADAAGAAGLLTGLPGFTGAGPAGPLGLLATAEAAAGLAADEGPSPAPDTGEAAGLAAARGGLVLRAASGTLVPLASGASPGLPKRDGMGKGGGAAKPKMVLLALAFVGP